MADLITNGTRCTCGAGHATFGECMRSKNLKIAYCQSHEGIDATKQRKWDRELDMYASARAQGIQPQGTKESDVRAALDISDATGRPFDADKPFTGTAMESGGEVVTF
jgi:hypothetical protein